MKHNTNTQTRIETLRWGRTIAVIKFGVFSGVLAGLAIVGTVSGVNLAPAVAVTPTTQMSAQATTVLTAQQGRDPLRCSAFLVYGDASWYKAQKFFYSLHGAYGVGGVLDSDYDGYACESLAQRTMSLNEPDCFRPVLKPWKKDCSARTQYRTITHLTSRRDSLAIRSALLDIYMPYAAVSPDVASDLMEALKCASGSATETMQVFIRTEQIRDEALQAFTGLLGLGNKALRIKRKTPGNPVNYATLADYAKVYQRYLELAGDVAVWSTGLALTDQARTGLQEMGAFDCDNI